MALVEDLKDARYGTVQAKAIYVGAEKVWPPVWTPADIPGLVAWIDVTQDSFTDGQTPGTYVEHSDAHRTFTVSSNPPIWRASSVGGKPRLEFQYTGLYCDGVDLGPNGLTYVMVHRATLIGNYQMMWTCYTPSNGYEMRYEGTAFKTQIVANYAAGGAVMTNPYVMSADVDYINTLRVRMDTHKVEHWINGANRIEGNSAATMHTGGQTLRMGFRADGYYSYGLFAEALCYAGPVSDADLALLTTYLQEKWGIFA